MTRSPLLLLVLSLSSAGLAGCPDTVGQIGRTVGGYAGASITFEDPSSVPSAWQADGGTLWVLAADLGADEGFSQRVHQATYLVDVSVVEDEPGADGVVRPVHVQMNVNIDVYGGPGEGSGSVAIRKEMEAGGFIEVVIDDCVITIDGEDERDGRGTCGGGTATFDGGLTAPGVSVEAWWDGYGYSTAGNAPK